MTTPELHVDGTLTVKHIARNDEGNTLLVLVSHGEPVSQSDCFRWGRRIGTPAGTQWHFRMSDTVAYCEWPAPSKRAVVQP